MRYSLENSDEVYRLEKQAQMKGYRPEHELAKMVINPKGKVLDAGCGTGVMSRAIQESYPDADVYACDISDDRLAFGRKMASAAGLHNIKFVHSDLQSIDVGMRAFDSIVCRYVLQHVKDPRAILGELHRVLGHAGILNVVESDGIFFNMYCSDVFVRDCLDELKRNVSFDLFVGRKIPVMMKECGFASVDWHVELMEFKGRALDDEYVLTEERLQFAMPLFVSILGDVKGRSFASAYLQALKSPETTLFYNKFIVIGHKE